MSDGVISRGEVLSLIVRLAALTTVSYYTMKLLMDAVDPTRKQKLAAQKRAEKLLKRYKRQCTEVLLFKVFFVV